MIKFGPSGFCDEFYENNGINEKKKSNMGFRRFSKKYKNDIKSATFL